MVESDSKSHLIKQICEIFNHANSSCPHRRQTFNPFMDWYILLQVEDNVSVDLLRKKYHKYALLLHPDKNKHPKAEFAFKLVSEAYACLSDEAKRLEFDVKRQNNLCKECIKTPQSKTKVKGGSFSPSDRSRSKKISARVKEVKTRFMEEARVIDKCLKVNANVDVFDKETPVFDPNDYTTQGQKYPHFRVVRCNDQSKNNKWLKKIFKFDDQERPMKAKCDSPIFECKPHRPSRKLVS